MRKKRETHGMYGTRIYKIWACMCYRCKDTRNKDYGGRGITVCDEWKKSFLAFYDWAISHGYSDGMTIERVDVNSDYTPNNCTFIPRAHQARNKRTTINVTINGETKCIAEWARIAGLSDECIYYRFRNGVTGDALLAEPDAPVYAELERETGIQATTIRARVRSGWDKDKILVPPIDHRAYLTINGVTKPRKQWSEEYGIPYTTLWNRINAGDTGDDLLRPPSPLRKHS
jgi:hypothetical protein